jgi:hypothetical protein
VDPAVALIGGWSFDGVGSGRCARRKLLKDIETSKRSA